MKIRDMAIVSFIIICCSLAILAFILQLINPQPNPVNQKAIHDLIVRLDSKAFDYNISYLKTRDAHFWAGHSGAADWTEFSNVSMGVRGGMLNNYSLEYSKQGSIPSESENYFEYYDKSQNKTCTGQTVSESGCRAIPISLKLGGILNGCKISTYPDGTGKCICDGEMKPIADSPGFNCSENRNTDNMTLGFPWAFYYPESNKSFCYVEARDNADKALWAFECNQKNIELAPLIMNNTEPLSGVKCIQYANDCSCSFNPVKTLSCSEGTPGNDYQNMKQDIIDYLKFISDNKSQYMSAVTEENNGYGHCYSFFYDNLTNTVCFDDQNLVTYGQWGPNERGPGFAHIDIKRIERTK